MRQKGAQVLCIDELAERWDILRLTRLSTGSMSLLGREMKDKMRGVVLHCRWHYAAS